MLRHELPFRGKDSMKKLEQFSIVVCGAGAIGSNLVFNLSKQGITQIKVIDNDRVEEHNIGTQIYGPDQVGSLKIAALADSVFSSSGIEIGSSSSKVTAANAHKIPTAHLIVDAFDNSESRQVLFDYSKKSGIPCIHAGFNGAFAEIKWNERYLVPSNAGTDICDYPLARNLVTLTVSLLAEAIVRYATKHEKINMEITFNDLRVNIF